MIKWRSDTFVSPCIKHILLTVRNATQQFAKIPIVCISFCTIDPIDNVSVNSVLWVFWNNVSFHDKQSKEEPLYTYSLFNIMTIICLERKTFIFSGVSMWQSRFDYSFLYFIEKKLPQKRLAISNDVTKICQIISSITIQLDTYVRLTHNKNKLTKHLQVPLFIALKS